MHNFEHLDPEKEILKKEGLKMVLVDNTRWCNHRDYFINCIRNLNPMQIVVAEGQFEVKQEVKVHVRFRIKLLNQFACS